MLTKFLLLSEVAEIARVSISTVRHWLKHKGLPSIKPGKLRMVKESDLYAFLHSEPITQDPAPKAGPQ